MVFGEDDSNIVQYSVWVAFNKITLSISVFSQKHRSEINSKRVGY